jgi:hypothetical protein
MLASSVLNRLRMALLATLTVALVATGWAHRVPDVSDKALAFLAATGATAADLCGEVGQGGLHVDPLCQACQIVGGADVPQLCGPPRRAELSVAVGMVVPRGPRVVARALDLAHRPQGPPVA